MNKKRYYLHQKRCATFDEDLKKAFIKVREAGTGNETGINTSTIVSWWPAEHEESVMQCILVTLTSHERMELTRMLEYRRKEYLPITEGVIVQIIDSIQERIASSQVLLWKTEETKRIESQADTRLGTEQEPGSYEEEWYGG